MIHRYHQRHYQSCLGVFLDGFVVWLGPYTKEKTNGIDLCILWRLITDPPVYHRNISPSVPLLYWYGNPHWYFRSGAAFGLSHHWDEIVPSIGEQRRLPTRGVPCRQVSSPILRHKQLREPCSKLPHDSQGLYGCMNRSIEKFFYDSTRIAFGNSFAEW